MVINSFTNDNIKYLRSLYQKKYRREENKFVLEGIRILEEAIKEEMKIDKVFYSRYLLRNERGKELLDSLQELRLDIIEIDDNLLTRVADTESPQGVLAVVEKVSSRLEEVIDNDNKLILIVDRVQDPGNLGTIIRTADAAGVDGIITTKGTVSLYNQKTIRATMGSLFRVPVCKVNDLVELIEEIESRDINTIVGDINGSKYHFEVDYSKATAIIVGNEGNGPREELLKFADESIKIPLVGDAESLNVAMATGIIVYEAVRQRMV